MKKVIFIAFILTGQLFAQIENGLYYSEDIYRSDVDNYKKYNTIEMETASYVNITSNGIRIYPENGIGIYQAWIDIGIFSEHYTYLLNNGSKICVGPEIKGIYYFYENEYDVLEYKKLIEFRNMKKISKSETGNYVMER
tara:strand:- start:214 stop:630 length:417 start_codon:yes stop_codon:yes gene_type:complete